MIRGGIRRDPAPLLHPNAPPPSAFPRKNSPSTPENADLGPFFVRWANFFALAPSPGQAGRTFARTGHGHVPTLKPITPLQPLMQASMKPPAPLLAPKQRPLKPATPLQPKNARKTAFSHPQRRWRFQLGLGRHPQRRQRFQTTGPAGRQGLAAVPVGGGEAWPGDQCAADVTNVVKPTRFKSPREDLCYKRRQSEPKTSIFSEKADGLTTFVTTRAGQHTATSRIGVEGAGGTGGPGCGAGGPGCGTGGRRRGLAGLRDDVPATHQHTRPHRCGGRRRARRARAGFEARRRTK